jgi:hypothetical protein
MLVEMQSVAQCHDSWLTVERGIFVKKLNTHEIYKLGITLFPLSEFKQQDTTMTAVIIPLLRSRAELNRHIGEDGIFSPSCKRATAALLRAFIDAGLPEKFEQGFDGEKKVTRYQIINIQQRLKDFETVLANELPGLSTYYVITKGIYSTDDLITHADQHLPESLRCDLPEQAKKDMKEAGRCLAFEVPTASAFHMWRAVESVMNKYYEHLTGKTFEAAEILRNWGQYIKALEDAGADAKITVFLDHIRAEYRNPISHPSENVDLDNAFGLFGTSFSVIGQIIKEIQTDKLTKAFCAAADNQGKSKAMVLAGLTGITAPAVTTTD